jgi:hypothetical protein
MVGRCALLDRQRISADDGRVRDGLRFCRPRPLRGAHQVSYLLIGRLGEIPVRVPDSEERRWRRRADHLIGQDSRVAVGGLRSGRRCYHDPTGLQLAERLDRRAHARASRQAVVDHDHYFAGNIREGPALPVGPFAAQQLTTLPFGDLLDHHR